MRTVNSVTGSEGEISPLAGRCSPQIFCSVWLSVRAEGLGRATEPRRKERQFLIKAVFG